MEFLNPLYRKTLVKPKKEERKLVSLMRYKSRPRSQKKMGQKKPKNSDFEIIPAPDSKEAMEMIQENSPAFSSPVGNPTLNKSDRKTSCLKQKPKCSEKKSEPKRRSIK